MERPPSLRAIAVATGVSVSTVSRYLRGQLALRPETEARLLDAAEKLGYHQAAERSASRPNRRPRQGTIGLVLPELRNTYFGVAADEIVRAAESHGLAVVIASTLLHSRHQEDYVELLGGLGVSGLIYSGNSISNPALSVLARSEIPIVVFDEHVENVPNADEVLIDDYSGGFQATALLTSLGHRRIAFVGGPPELLSVRRRGDGWADALRQAGVDPAQQLSLPGDYTLDFGSAAVSYLLSAAERPTAVFAASDVVALGLLSAARSLGVRIPEELSIVGYDDIPQSALVTPRLTTVRTPLNQMADTAVSLLVDRIADPTRSPRTVITPVTLVSGGSVARLGEAPAAR
ncbi:LacI family DNA-binding transcriptional regulator [Gryllotalpicola koreensis]|uniref:LacI family DNA-binding transcriptional regulator n=1 Tax=Gryllotalpicola koreensis TaxID=993086 RepID=UPI0031D6943E